MISLKLKHVNGKRPIYEIPAGDFESEISDKYIFENNGLVYFSEHYEVINPEIIDQQLPNGEPSTIEPINIDAIKVQSVTGTTSVIENPEYDYEFDGKNLIYNDNRVVEVNGYSVSHLNPEVKFDRMAYLYGVIPKLVDVKRDFPKYDEPKITLTGIDETTFQEKTFEFYGKEVETVWSHIIYFTESDKLQILMNQKPIMITKVNGEVIQPKDIYLERNTGILYA